MKERDASELRRFKDNVVDTELKRTGMLQGKYVIKDKYKTPRSHRDC